LKAGFPPGGLGVCARDASAVLALLNQEPGARKLTPELLSDSAASTVNLAEVQTKLVRDGGEPNEAWELALAPISESEPFTSEQAKVAGTLVKLSRPLGLSLGDRACLALAMTLKAPVYTTDREWKNLKLGIPIHILR
jgi:PIN domain nuclease of toxin-antitoxin system